MSVLASSPRRSAGQGRLQNHLAGHGLPQCAYRWITIDDGIVRRPDGSQVQLLTEVDAAIDELGLPMFVKPQTWDRRSASRGPRTPTRSQQRRVGGVYDHEVILEKEVIGREIEIAVLGNEDPEARSPARSCRAPTSTTMPTVRRRRRSPDPAPLTATNWRLQSLAIGAYRVKVEGLAASISSSRTGPATPPTPGLAINEIATMPGFTPISMYPKMWQASGLDYASLIDRLVRLALQRHARQLRHTARDTSSERAGRLSLDRQVTRRRSNIAISHVNKMA